MSFDNFVSPVWKLNNPYCHNVHNYTQQMYRVRNRFNEAKMKRENAAYETCLSTLKYAFISRCSRLYNWPVGI